MKIIAVIPVYGIHQDRIKRFFNLNYQSLKKFHIDVCLVESIRDRNPITRLGPTITMKVVYPNDIGVFSISRVCNFGIRSVSKWLTNDDIIIKTDIDICHTADAMETIINAVGTGRACFPWPRTVKRYAPVKDLNPVIFRKYPGYGVVAMTVCDWLRLKGFNERMSGWGMDDIDLFRRASDIIQAVRLCYVYHYNHSKGIREYNPNRIVEYPISNSLNKVISRYGWDEDDWGLAKYDEFNQQAFLSGQT